MIFKFTLEKIEEIEYNNKGYKSASVAELVDALFSGSSGSSRVGSSPTSCTKKLNLIIKNLQKQIKCGIIVIRAKY